MPMIEFGTQFIAVAAGGSHNLALKSDGTVLAWGANRDGQSSVPSGLSGVIAISAGMGLSLALVADPPPNTLLPLRLQTDAGFRMAFYGITSSHYTLETSSNLLDWAPVTDFVITNSPTILSGPEAIDQKQRYYRALMRERP